MGMEKKKTRSSSVKPKKRMRENCPVSMTVSSYDTEE